MDRRTFLGRGAGLAASALLGTAAGAAPAGGHDVLDASLDTWDGVRAQFDLRPDVRIFSGFLLAPHPRPVREAIERHRQGLDAFPSGYLAENDGPREQETLEAAGAYLDVRPDDIALTDSTTMGLGVLYGGFPLRPADEILTTEHDHFAHHGALAVAAARAGATVRRVRLYDTPEAASADAIVASLMAGVGPRTRLVAVTWVHSGTGVKLPIARIAGALAEHNRGRAPGERVLLAVDGVHGLGVEDATLPALGCDFFVAGTHKWLFGPRGTGLLWGRPDALASVAATIPAFGSRSYRSSSAPSHGARLTPGGYHSFEHRWALVEAFRFHQAIGRARIADRVHALNDRLKEGLAGMGHVRLRTPRARELSAGLVCFEVDRLSPDAVISRLADRGVIGSVAPYAARYARLSAGLLTLEGDVVAAVAAVAALR